jgi:hypothetical protein
VRAARRRLPAYAHEEWRQRVDAAGSRMSTQQVVNYAAADGAGLLAGK